MNVRCKVSAASLQKKKGQHTAQPATARRGAITQKQPANTLRKGARLLGTRIHDTQFPGSGATTQKQSADNLREGTRPLGTRFPGNACLRLFDP